MFGFEILVASATHGLCFNSHPEGYVGGGVAQPPCAILRWSLMPYATDYFWVFNLANTVHEHVDDSIGENSDSDGEQVLPKLG